MFHIALRKTVIYPHLLDTVDPENVYYKTKITYSLKVVCKKIDEEFYCAIWEPNKNKYRKAGGLIEALKKGRAFLRKERQYVKSYIPRSSFNGYEELVTFVNDYIKACETYPESKIIIYELSKPEM